MDNKDRVKKSDVVIGTMLICMVIIFDGHFTRSAIVQSKPVVNVNYKDHIGDATELVEPAESEGEDE